MLEAERALAVVSELSEHDRKALQPSSELALSSSSTFVSTDILFYTAYETYPPKYYVIDPNFILNLELCQMLYLSFHNYARDLEIFSWKPAEVVPEHKGRAAVLFSGLIVAIFAYTGFLVYQAVEASENPSTSFVLSNNVYKYPDIHVCLYNYYGCDTVELEGDCRDSAQITEGGSSTAVYNPDGDDEQTLQVNAEYSEEKGWCVSFAASEIVVPEGQRDPEDYILLNMYWYPGGEANSSTTCIDEEGEWESHSESVLVTLRDADTGDYSGGIRVPYSCTTSASSSHVFAYMGIGLTKDNKIRSDDTASYKAVAMSSAVEKDKRDSTITGITSPYAWLSMEIAQEENSLEEITEIDPLDIAEIFGNVGGFWDLLLLLWPLFFIATTRQDPHLKVRNFKKSMTRGSERVVGLSKPIRKSASMRRRRELARRAGQRTTADTGDQRPAWEDTDASSRQENPPPEHDPRSPRASGDTLSTQSAYSSSVSRAAVTRVLLPSQGSRLRSSPESPREAAASKGQTLVRAPISQDSTESPIPLRAAPTAIPSNSPMSAVFTV